MKSKDCEPAFFTNIENVAVVVFQSAKYNYILFLNW